MLLTHPIGTNFGGPMEMVSALRRTYQQNLVGQKMFSGELPFMVWVGLRPWSGRIKYG